MSGSRTLGLLLAWVSAATLLWDERLRHQAQHLQRTQPEAWAKTLGYVAVLALMWGFLRLVRDSGTEFPLGRWHISLEAVFRPWLPSPGHTCCGTSSTNRRRALSWRTPRTRCDSRASSPDSCWRKREAGDRSRGNRHRYPVPKPPLPPPDDPAVHERTDHRRDAGPDGRVLIGWPGSMGASPAGGLRGGRGVVPRY